MSVKKIQFIDCKMDSIVIAEFAGR